MALYSKITNYKTDIYLKVDNVYCHDHTPFQEIEIVDIKGHGKTLILDNELQTCTVDTFVYHEGLIGSPYTPGPEEKVLVLGCGEGCSIDVLLRKGWKHIDAVDIDEKAIGYYRKHLSDWNNYIYDRTDEYNLIIDDGFKIMNATPDNYYSYVIYDLPTLGLKNNLEEWLNEIYRILKPNGLLSAQDGPKIKPSISGPLLREIFETEPERRCLQDWSFIHCAKKDLTEPILPE